MSYLSVWKEEESKYNRLEYQKGITNGWCQGDFTKFPMRGKKYLTDGKKNPSAEPLFVPVGLNVYRTEKRLYHAAKNIPSLREFLKLKSDMYKDQFFIVTFQLPSTPQVSAVHLFGRNLAPRDDEPADLLLNKFKNGDSAFRNSRFKFISSIVDGPALVRAAASNLGGQKPSILGNKLDVRHYSGENYFEINIDVGSSKVASMIQGIILNNTKKLCIEESFLLEGHCEEELPERLLGVVRCIYCDFGNESSIALDLPEGYDVEKESAEGVIVHDNSVPVVTPPPVSTSTDEDELIAAFSNFKTTEDNDDDDDDDDDDDFQDLE